MKIERPIVWFDCETTGTDPYSDRIVQLAVIRCSPGAPTTSQEWLVCPNRPIPAEATEVHGISDADVSSAPCFYQVHREVMEWFEGADIGGFNVSRFDVPLLEAEFERCGVEFEVEGRSIVDLCFMFKKMQPRDLASAVRLYLEREHLDAHTAMADTSVLPELLRAMLVEHEELPRTRDALHLFCDPDGRYASPIDQWFDRTGDAPVFKRGKHEGKTLDEVRRVAPDYLDWMRNRAERVPRSVKEFVRGAAS